MISYNIRMFCCRCCWRSCLVVENLMQMKMANWHWHTIKQNESLTHPHVWHVMWQLDQNTTATTHTLREKKRRNINRRTSNTFGNISLAMFVCVGLLSWPLTHSLVISSCTANVNAIGLDLSSKNLKWQKCQAHKTTQSGRWEAEAEMDQREGKKVRKFGLKKVVEFNNNKRACCVENKWEIWYRYRGI